MSKVAGGWDTGLLECGADVKICLVSWCCGCCQVAHQRAALESRECSFGDSILVFLCPLCCQVKTRGEVREKYGIEGSALSDCCAYALRHRPAAPPAADARERTEGLPDGVKKLPTHTDLKAKRNTKTTQNTTQCNRI
eukprot:TRINITY_DN2797_c0_g1_i1.p2 TRINITY_DN2797_c0_g1~~TRINITY_DN2797_c0_g1_i1.p2  ORF type:complete len:138 (+),score=18.22 TRINITY_DN2797_c0_g1_i1:49-462(+)